MTERGLPHDWNIEQVLLGSLIASGDVSAVVDRVKPTDFHKPTHQLIYQHILACAAEGQAPSPARLLRRIESSGAMEALATVSHLGPIHYIMDLSSRGVIPEMFGGVVRDLLRDSRRRAAVLELRALEERLLTDVDVDPAVGVMEMQARLDALQGPSEDEARYIGELIDTQVEAATKRSANPGRVAGVLTGFHDLDDAMLGWDPGETIVIGGSPGTGKTMFVQDVATSIAANQGGVVFFQLEMTGPQLADRHLISKAQLDNDRFRRGLVSADEWRRIYDVQEKDRPLDIRVDTRAGLTVPMLRARLRRYLAQRPARVCIVDFLQLLRPTSKGKVSEEAAIAENMAGLAQLAKDENVVMVVLSQLNRDFHKRTSKRPETGDLRGSGFIEVSANAILMLYRDEMWNEDTTDRGVAEVIIRKQRRGPCSTIRLAFDGQYYRYRNLEERRAADERPRGGGYR